MSQVKFEVKFMKLKKEVEVEKVEIELDENVSNTIREYVESLSKIEKVVVKNVYSLEEYALLSNLYVGLELPELRNFVNRIEYVGNLALSFNIKNGDNVRLVGEVEGYPLYVHYSNKGYVKFLFSKRKDFTVIVKKFKNFVLILILHFPFPPY